MNNFATLISCSVQVLTPFLERCLANISIIRMTKSRRMRWAGHETRMGEKGTAYRILVGEPGGESLFGRPRRWWVDNIKMDLRDRMGWCSRLD
jgi:hypothetical protein